MITPRVPGVSRIANELITLADDADGMLADPCAAAPPRPAAVTEKVMIASLTHDLPAIAISAGAVASTNHRLGQVR